MKLDKTESSASTDLCFSQMLDMQYKLWEKNKHCWSPLEPNAARSHLLWMIGEIGEVADIIKKCGEQCIMQQDDVRAAFIEEMCDVLMYFNDILLQFGITAHDFSQLYVDKYNKNMARDYKTENERFTDSL